MATYACQGDTYFVNQVHFSTFWHLLNNAKEFRQFEMKYPFY